MKGEERWSTHGYAQYVARGKLEGLAEDVIFAGNAAMNGQSREEK